MENFDNKYSFDPKILKALIERGPDFLKELFRLAMNEVMKMELEKFLNVGAYERSKNRLDYANGFYPQALRKGLRSERALIIAMAEMYVQGVSTRKVKNILEKTCGLEVSSSQVSDATVLQAVGINAAGKREVVGMPISISEAEVHWRKFFTILVNRGLHGVKLIVSDDHPGMKAARVGIFPATPWRRCYFHLCQNARSYARKLEERKEISRTIRDIFSRCSKDDASIALWGAVV